MPTELQRAEKRRGERVLIRIPIEFQGKAQGGAEIREEAETAVVSRYGALLRLHSLLEKGSQLNITNRFTQQVEPFRVVWIAGQLNDGFWDTGVEALNPRDDFWGIHFPPSDRKA